MQILRKCWNFVLELIFSSLQSLQNFVVLTCETPGFFVSFEPFYNLVELCFNEAIMNYAQGIQMVFIWFIYPVLIFHFSKYYLFILD